MLRMKLLRRMICTRVKAGKNAKRFDVNMLQGKVRMIKEGRQPGVCYTEKLVIEPGSYGKRKGQWKTSGEQ